MNDLQKGTIRELQKILPQSHFINIKVRIDGEWREYEADFLKEILAGQVEPVVSDDCELRGRLKENQMYYNLITDFYYSDMNKDENTLLLKIRDLFAIRIKDLKKNYEKNTSKL